MPSGGSQHVQEARANRGRGAAAWSEVSRSSRGTTIEESRPAESVTYPERVVRRSRATRSRARPRRCYDSGSRAASADEVRDREETPQPVDRILVSREAEDEILDTFLFYESRRPALGARFLTSLAATLDRLAKHPESSPLVYGRIRRARLLRFPYSVLYTVRGEALRLLALMHDRRRPERSRFLH